MHKLSTFFSVFLPLFHCILISIILSCPVLYFFLCGKKIVCQLLKCKSQFLKQ